MAKIKLDLPLGEHAVTGKMVTFVAPCSCTDTEAIQIDGVDYVVVDALCNCVTGKFGRWETGATVTIILDAENKYAYLQNGNLAADQIAVPAATATALGLEAGVNVDDALGKLSSLYAYAWARRTPATVELGVETSVAVVSAITTSGTSTIVYSKEVGATATGQVFLVEPTTMSVSYSTAHVADALAGCYFKNIDGLYYASPNADAYPNEINSNYIVWIRPAALVLSATPAGEWETVVSFNRNAYPDSGRADGYEYMYLGVPFDNAALLPIKLDDKAKIEFGTYVGTGTTSGITLNFPFKPQLVIVYSGSGTFAPAWDTAISVMIAGRGMTEYATYGNTNGAYARARLSWGDAALSWSLEHSNAGSEAYVFNSRGAPYNYIALG